MGVEGVYRFRDLPALGHYVRQGRCALFVGAGLSVGAGLPTWHQLIERIVPSVTPYAVAQEELAKLEACADIAKAEAGVENPSSQEDLEQLVTGMLGLERSRELFSNRPASAVQYRQSVASVDALDRIRRDSGLSQEISALLAAEKFPELAGYCRDLLGRRRFHELVRRELQPTGDIPDVHRAIVSTPYACVVTTNFDSLLEDAYARWDSRGVPRTPTGAELAQQGTLLFDDTFFILKAHGDLDEESSIIFTSEDYRRVSHSNPAFQAMLTGILLRHAVLFVGYSLSDPNFRALLDSQLTIFNEQVPPRYALMEGIGEAEREILWRTAKLRVFNYEKGKHEAVGHFLTTLASRAGAAPDAKSRVSRPADSARPLVARPDPVGGFELAIGASGDRIVLELQEETPGGWANTVWSGGSPWPRWPELRTGLKSVLYRLDVGLSDLSAIGAHLQRSLPDELLRHLDQIPPERMVMLSLTAETETVPWEWLIVDGSPLCLRNPVVRRPTGISDKARGRRLAGAPLRALMIGDAGVGNRWDSAKFPFPGAAVEIREVADLLKGKDAVVTPLEREQATYVRLVSEVEQGDYDIVHFAGHAWFEGSEAHLYLWDGSVSSSELTSILNRRPPALLVLNSHYTAFVPCGIEFDDPPGAVPASPPGVDRPLPPPLGFMGLASRSGVGAFVGCYGGAVRDDTAARFAIEFYTPLLQGERFGDALHSARKATTDMNDATGMCYAGSGYPETVLASRPLR